MQISLLVTDVGLPGGMNGRQLADAARQEVPQLKVQFITGYAEGAVMGKGQLESGMRLVTKPFIIEAWAARIEDCVAKVELATAETNCRSTAGSRGGRQSVLGAGRSVVETYCVISARLSIPL